MEVDRVFKFLCKKPKVLSARAQMLSMWLFQAKSIFMVTPRYFAESVVSRVWPLSWQGYFRTFLALVTGSVVHFSG